MQFHLMNREQLIAHINLLEYKIILYSERDWLMTQCYIEQLKQCDMLLLDMYDQDVIIKQA